MSAVLLVVAERYPSGHVVRPADRARIECQGTTALGHCGRPAERCEIMHWSCSGGGVSFFYYCDRCWITDNGCGTSPRDRAHGRRT